MAFTQPELSTLRDMMQNELENAAETLSEMEHDGSTADEITNQNGYIEEAAVILRKLDAVLAEPEKSPEVFPLKGFSVEQLNIVVDSIYGEWKYQGTMTHTSGGFPRLWAPLDKATIDIFQEVRSKEE